MLLLYKTYLKVYYLSISLFLFIKVYGNFTIALTVILIGEERATNRCSLINTLERKNSNYSKQLLKSI